MNDLIPYCPGEIQFIFRQKLDRFIAINIINDCNNYPIFLVFYPIDGTIYSLSTGKSTEPKYIFNESEFYENEEDIAFNGYLYMVFNGNPLEFIRYMQSEIVYNYFTDICKCNFDELPLPDIFSKELVDKYLNDLSKKNIDYKYKKSLEKDFRDLKKQQLITWGFTLTSLLLSIYNIFFK